MHRSLGGKNRIMAGSSYATASRRKILEYLKNSNDHTVTAADVDEYLREHDSEVNITTIYRYLDKLAKDGTVIKYVAEKGCQAAYQYVEPLVAGGADSRQGNFEPAGGLPGRRNYGRGADRRQGGQRCDCRA